MNFLETKIKGLILVEPKVFGDERGFFFESYNEKVFFKNWIKARFVQDNHSKSKKWTLRGLHFQTKNTQAKLVRVTRGSVYDVAVDLRKESETYGEWFGVVLSAENKKQLFVPKGFAHGFLTLKDGTEFLYKCDDFYNPEFDWGVFFADEKIWINWKEIQKKYGISELLLSEKDKNQPKLEDFEKVNPF